MLEINAQGEIECITENIKDLIQRDRAELYRKSIFSIVHVKDHAKLRPILRNIQTFNWSSGEIDKFHVIQTQLLINNSNGTECARWVKFKHITYICICCYKRLKICILLGILLIIFPPLVFGRQLTRKPLYKSKGLFYAPFSVYFNNYKMKNIFITLNIESILGTFYIFLLLMIELRFFCITDLLENCWVCYNFELIWMIGLWYFIEFWTWIESFESKNWMIHIVFGVVMKNSKYHYYILMLSVCFWFFQTDKLKT